MGLGIVLLGLGEGLVGGEGGWCYAAQEEFPGEVVGPIGTVVENFGTGYIDWKRGDLQAYGYGAEPEGVRGPRARVWAIRIARVDAQRNLAEIVAGVRVTARTYVRNLAEVEDVIRTEVNAFLQGVQISPPQRLEDGTWRVKAFAPLHGPQGLSYRLYPHLLRPSQPGGDTGGYTGLVVDARKVDLRAGLAPIIRDPERTEVWNAECAGLDYVLRAGAVEYTDSLEEALTRSRAGKRPLVVKAQGVTGETRTDPVVTAADGLKIAPLERRRRAQGRPLVFVSLTGTRTLLTGEVEGKKVIIPVSPFQRVVIVLKKNGEEAPKQETPTRS